MTNLTRRGLMKSGTVLTTTGAVIGPALLEWAKAWAQTAPWTPERGAQLSLLRWRYFVRAEDEAFVAAMDAFTKVTGVKINLTRESNDDIQPKASVAASVGVGPDLFWGYYSLPHLFSDQCLDLTDVADYLGKKYGGWAPSAIAYGKGAGNRWIGIPVSFAGSIINYRISSLRKAGYSKFPETTAEFLDYAKAMKANGTPGGMSLGHATNDANNWVYWCLWTYGGNIVDKNDKVIINSPETQAALVFAKQLYEQMAPGVLSWNDASNNKAFLGNEVHWTNNTISIYVAAKRDPTLTKIADDMDHAYWPIGPAGRATEFNIETIMLAMRYAKYPQACKALLAFIMEADQYNKWLVASQGLSSHTLNAYENNSVWTEDPKNTPFRDAPVLARPIPGFSRAVSTGHVYPAGRRVSVTMRETVQSFQVGGALAGAGKDEGQCACANGAVW